MSIEIVDGATILNFVNDDVAFSAAVQRRFAELDVDGDGFLSFTEMLAELRCVQLLELTDETGSDGADADGVYRRLFAQFDRDGDGVVGPEEYAAETREMMVAIGRGMGFAPLQMALGPNSLLLAAASAAKCPAPLH